MGDDLAELFELEEVFKLKPGDETRRPFSRCVKLNCDDTLRLSFSAIRIRSTKFALQKDAYLSQCVAFGIRAAEWWIRRAIWGAFLRRPMLA